MYVWNCIWRFDRKTAWNCFWRFDRKAAWNCFWRFDQKLLEIASEDRTEKRLEISSEDSTEKYSKLLLKIRLKNCLKLLLKIIDRKTAFCFFTDKKKMTATGEMSHNQKKVRPKHFLKVRLWRLKAQKVDYLSFYYTPQSKTKPIFGILVHDHFHSVPQCFSNI